MKKFGKIFGITTLAFATLTAGVIGLAGCGEKWKNPDNTPEPEKPPIIVTPPKEETPLVGMVTLDEIDTYFKRPDVKLSFDAFKVNSDSNMTDNENSDLKDIEFFASVDAKQTSRNMVLKFTYKDDHTETNYVTGSEKALFVLTEKAGEEQKKRKFLEGEEYNSILDIMSETYENTQDATPSFEDLKNISTSSTTLDFYYSAVRKSFNEDLSYEINFEYNEWEDIGSSEGIVRVRAYYEINVVYNFSNNEIQSLISSCTRTEKGSSEVITSSIKVEKIGSLDMPTDFDEYVLEEELTLEQAGQYFSDSNVVSVFDGFNVTASEKVNNVTGEFSALKEGETFKTSSTNFFEDDDKVYYVLNDNRVFVVDGEIVTQVTDEAKVSQILDENAQFCQTYSDAKRTFDDFASKCNATVEKELSVKKFTVGDSVQIVIEFSYNAFIAEGDEEVKIDVNYKETLIFDFVDGKIQSFSHSFITTKLDDEEIIESLFEEVSKIDTLEFPEFPTAPEGGDEGETEGGNEGGEVAGGEEQLPETV